MCPSALRTRRKYYYLSWSGSCATPAGFATDSAVLIPVPIVRQHSIALCRAVSSENFAPDVRNGVGTAASQKRLTTQFLRFLGTGKCWSPSLPALLSGTLNGVANDFLAHAHNLCDLSVEYISRLTPGHPGALPSHEEGEQGVFEAGSPLCGPGQCHGSDRRSPHASFRFRGALMALNRPTEESLAATLHSVKVSCICCLHKEVQAKATCAIEALTLWGCLATLHHWLACHM